MDQLKCINHSKMDHSDPFFQRLVSQYTRQQKWLILSDIKRNELTQDSDLYMASLDFDALFTNIRLDNNIDICVKKTFQKLGNLFKEIFKNDFRDLLNFATKESFFTFTKFISRQMMLLWVPSGFSADNHFLFAS